MEHTAIKTSNSLGCSFFSLALFKNTIKRYFFVPTIYLVILLFCIPFVMYTRYVEITNMDYKDAGYNITHDFLDFMRMACNPFVASVVGLCVALSVFAFLFNQKSNYMMHAFPFNRKMIFITSVITGLVMLFVPLLIAAIVTLPIANLGGPLCVKALLVDFLQAIELNFFFFAVAIFVVMCTGMTVAVPILYYILNFLFAALKEILNAVYALFLYGVTGSSYDSSPTVLSPLLYLLSKRTGGYIEKMYSDEGAVISLDEFQVGVLGYVNALLFAGIIILLIAYVIYKKKHIESIGSLLPMRWTRPVFRWGVSFCVASLVGLFIRYTVPIPEYISEVSLGIFIMSYVACGLIVFFATQMLIAKKFKVFNKSNFVECAVMIAVFCILVLCSYLDIAGVEKRVPQLSEVEKITCSMGGETIIVNPIEDSEIAEEILNIHGVIVSEKEELINRSLSQYYNEGNNSYEYLSLDYLLKNGKMLRRNYSVYYYKDEPIQFDKSYSQTIDKINSPQFAEKVLLGGYDKETLIPYYTEFSWEKMNKDSEVYDAETPYERNNWSSLNHDECEKIYEALLDDIEAGNIKLIKMRNENNRYSYVNLVINFTIDGEEDYNKFDIYKNIDEGAVFTIEALKECGVNI